MPFVRWPALLAAGVLALSGCADPPSADISGPKATVATPQQVHAAETTHLNGHDARYFGAVTREYDYTDPGITLTPPPGDGGTAVSWTTALETCFSGPIRCATAGGAQVALARVTGPGSAGTAAFGGRHMLEQALMYVVTWDPTDCPPVRPGGGSYPAGSGCRIVNLITAEKLGGGLPPGSHVYTFEVPESSPVAGR